MSKSTRVTVLATSGFLEVVAGALLVTTTAVEGATEPAATSGLKAVVGFSSPVAGTRLVGVAAGGAKSAIAGVSVYMPRQERAKSTTTPRCKHFFFPATKKKHIISIS